MLTMFFQAIKLTDRKREKWQKNYIWYFSDNIIL